MRSRLLPVALFALGLPALAQQVNLTCGTPVDATVIPPAFTFFSFTAQAGDAVVIRILRLVSDPKDTFFPRVTLTDSLNRTVAPRANAFVAGATSAGEYDLAGGTYRIQIQSSTAAGGAFRIVYMPLNRPCGGPSLNCGASQIDQVVTPLQVKSYQFQAQAGDILSARLAKISTPTSPLPAAFNISMYLYSPSGQSLTSLDNRVAAVQTGGLLFVRDDFQVTVDGPVTLVVFDVANLAGTFALSVTRLNGPCGGGGPLGCGVTTGTLAFPAEVDSYTATLGAGDVVSIRVAAADVSTALLPGIEVYDPQGTLVTLVAARNQTSHSVASGTFTATVSGVYRILAEDASSSIHTGGYALTYTLLNRPCNAQGVSCASVTDGSIDGLLQSSAYSLDAQANDVYLLRLLRTGPASQFRPRVDIYDAQGNVQGFLNTNDLGRLLFTAPASGHYSLLVSDSFDNTQTGPYSLSVLLLNRACSAGTRATLACGTLTSGNITRALDTAFYSYNAATGESFSIRMLDNSGGALQPSIEIYDPQGNLTGQSVGGTFTQTDVVKPAAGTYTILALSGSTSPATGAFAIDLLRTKNACGATTPAAGATVTGVVSGTSPFVTYSLSLANADALLARSASTTAGFAAQMELYDPDGARLDYATFGISRKASAAGAYTLIVGPSAPRSAGAYSLSWQLLNNPANAAALQCGGSATASISAASQYRYYTVGANQGDLMRLIFTKLSDTFSPQVELYTPAGARLTATSDVSQKAPADGGYLVMVGPSTSNSETGSYTIAYQRPNTPCSPVKLTCGQSSLRQANIPGQVDTFSFTATGGDQTSIRLTPRSGAYAPFVELYDSSGNRLGSTSAGLLRQVLPADGSYALLVRDRNGVNLGSYRVSLQDDSNTCAVDDSEPPSLTLVRPTGGEVLAGGATFRIQWLSDDNVGVAAHDVALSNDGGKTFGATIAGGLSGNAQAYDWSLPSDIAPSRSAVIRVTATDAAGNAQSVASDLLSLIGSGFPANSSVTFTYDALNRPIQAVLGDGRTIQYTWDAAGNLVAVTVTGQ